MHARLYNIIIQYIYMHAYIINLRLTRNILVVEVMTNISRNPGRVRYSHHLAASLSRCILHLRIRIRIG